MTKLFTGMDDTGSSTGNDMLMAKVMAEQLMKHYPGHLWAVQYESSTGMATILNLMLSGKWGYQLRIPAIYSASAFEADVKRAGGEILERFRMARGKFKDDDYAQLNTNFAGHFAFDK